MRIRHIILSSVAFPDIFARYIVHGTIFENKALDMIYVFLLLHRAYGRII